uniref:Uncharacterized protein n=1 Tax=Anguilla anguilla TaxID=7936 RepID=A0A0E9VW02_ANGAN
MAVSSKFVEVPVAKIGESVV